MPPLMSPEEDAAFRAQVDNRANGAPSSNGAWPALESSSLPAFPVDALPRDVRDWVRAISDEAQTPTDLAAMAALGVLGAAGMGRAMIDCGAWDEELGLYLLAVVPSGERKSTILRAATAPMREIERERAEAAAPVVRELQSRREVLEQRKRKLTKDAGQSADAADRDAAGAELLAVDEQLADVGEAVPPRLLADDATPEALGHLLAQHGSIAVLSAESALLDNLSGRYNDGSANLHVVCKAYGGEATVIDRRGREPERIERPLMSVVLVVQPHVLQALIDNPTARAQGLVARFGYSMPTTALGSRRIDTPRVPSEVSEAWAMCVRRVADADKTDRNVANVASCPVSVHSVSTSEAAKIMLTDEATALLRDLQARQEARLTETGDLRPVADWTARHPGRVVRIGGLLHLTEHPIGTPIGAGTLDRALTIGDYLLDHGLAALTGPDELVRKALRWFEARAEQTVTVRDLHRGPLGSRGSAEDAEALADSLERHGAIRPRLDPHAGKGRPPSPAYDVHPELLR